MKSIKFIYILSALAIQCKCRKYDIEEEAHKLYDEGFSVIVQKFRKTPEYVKILNNQMQLLTLEVSAIRESIFDMRFNDLKLAVVSLIQPNASESIKSMVMRSRNPFKRYTIKSKKKKPVKRRQNESPVNSLDKYGKLHSTLTLEERNKIRDLAFEYSGKAIHEIMDKSLPDGSVKRSTKLPDGGHQPTKTTTEHVHVATSSTDMSTNVDTDTTTTTTTHHHHHQSTVAPEMQRNFQIPKVTSKFF